MRSLFIGVCLALADIGIAQLNLFGAAQTVDEFAARSRSALDVWLGEKMRTVQIHVQPKILPIEDKSVALFFPNDRFFGVYIPRRPVAIPPPEGLLNETVVCVHEDQSLDPIAGWDALKDFLVRKMKDVTSESRAKSAVLAAFALASFGAKDGPYRFDEPNVSVSHEGNRIIATAKANVPDPGHGEIRVNLEFGPGGNIDPAGTTIGGSPRLGAPPDYSAPERRR